jgi:hypothetical protein
MACEKTPSESPVGTEEVAAHLWGKGIEGVGLDGVDGEQVVRVHAGEASRDCDSSLGPIQGKGKGGDAPNHFLLLLASFSMTSSTPGRRASMEGTWLARMPLRRRIRRHPVENQGLAYLPR